jgi:hypothetical protein
MSQQAIQAATTPTSPRKAPKPKPFPVTTKLEHGGRYQTAILQHGLTTAPVGDLVHIAISSVCNAL